MIYVTPESGLQDVCFSEDSPYHDSGEEDEEGEDKELASEEEWTDANEKAFCNLETQGSSGSNEAEKNAVTGKDNKKVDEEKNQLLNVGPGGVDERKSAVGVMDELAEGGTGEPEAKEHEDMSVDDGRFFLEYSLAVLEDIDSHFGYKSMEPRFLSWSGDEESSDLSNERLARLLYELRPFLPINPLDELTERIAAQCFPEPMDPLEVIANGTGRSYFYVRSDDDDPLLWVKRKTLPRNESM